jgi:hypothetical protein
MHDLRAIVRIELRKAGHGTGKAIALGMAAGVGVFFGIMALLVAAVGDLMDQTLRSNRGEEILPTRH